MNLQFTALIESVEAWAEERGIFSGSDDKTQMLKCVSEIGELADAVAKNRQSEIVDGIGDALVTLILLARMRGLTLEYCLEAAYQEISGRSGTMINGVFIKQSDMQ